MKNALKAGIRALVGLSVALTLVNPVAATSLWEGEIATGVGGLFATSHNPRLEEYQELPGGVLGPSGWLGLDRGDLRLRADFRFPTANDQHLDLGMGIGATDRLSVKVNYLRYQHLYGEEAHNLYTETAPGVLTLPDSLQAANQAGNSSQQFNNLLAAEMGTPPSVVRFQDTLGGGEVAYRIRPDLKVSVNGQVKLRQGHRPLSVYESSVITQLSAPLDQRTTDGTVAIEWMPRKTVVRLEGDLSSFEDNIGAITFDDLFVANPTSSKTNLGQYSQPPSNTAQGAGLFVSLDQIPRTRVTANVSVGRWYQDAAFLPYTVDAAATFGYNAVPNPASLAGRVDTFSQQYQVTALPIRKLKLMVRFRGYEMANKSSDVTVAGKASTGGSATGGNTYPDFFGERTYTGEGEARYDLPKGIGVNAGYVYQDVFRTNREFESSLEHTVKGGVDAAPEKWIKVALTGSQALRSVGTYNEDSWVEDGDMPGVRRYDEANRLRRDLGGDLRLSPTKDLNLSYRYTQGTDEFQPNGDMSGLVVPGSHSSPGTVLSTQQYGLLNDKHVMHSVTGDWQVTEAVGLNALYEFEAYNAVQGSAQPVSMSPSTSSLDYWQASTEEHYIVYGLGMDADLGSGLTSNLDYSHAYSRGRIQLTDLPDTMTVVEAGFPDTMTRKDDYTAKLAVKLDPTWSLSGWYTLEVYKVEDVANDFPGEVLTNPIAGTLVGVFLGNHPTDYVAHVAGMQVAARF